MNTPSHPPMTLKGLRGIGLPPAVPGETRAWALRVGRKLASRDLDWLIIGLLEARPQHGYELIRNVADQSQGYYAPSPGMIYPALARLTAAGLAAPEPDGLRKRYRLTGSGQHQLDSNRAAVTALCAQLTAAGRCMASMRGALADAGRPIATGPVDTRLDEARRALDAAVAAACGADAGQRDRVRQILVRAAAEIAGAMP